jgi:hypothetical protein
MCEILFEIGKNFYRDFSHVEASCGQKKACKESIKCEGVDRCYYGKGVIFHEFVPHGQTVNGQLYLEVMKCLREAE